MNIEEQIARQLFDTYSSYVFSTALFLVISVQTESMFKRGAPSLGHALFMVICVIMVLMTLIFRWRFLNTKYRNGLIFIAVSASFSTVQDVVGVLGSLSNAEQWTGNTIEGITTTAGIFFLVRGTKHLNAQANKRVRRTVFIGIIGSVVIIILGILKHF